MFVSDPPKSELKLPSLSSRRRVSMMEPVPEEAYYVDRFDDDLDDPTVHSKYPITFM